MIRFYLLLSLQLIVTSCFAQLSPDFNIEFQSQIQAEFPDTVAERYHCFNDIWGYTAPDGIEYAILGTCWSTLIYELTDPTNPKLVASIPGTSSVWRDMKTYEEFAYVVADEGTDGILIIDMRDLPNGVNHKFIRPFLNINGSSSDITTCHNLYINEGTMMLAGCSVNNGGVVFFDLTEDPFNPRFIGGGTNVYAHDVVANGNMMYTSDIFDGAFSIVELDQNNNPTILNNQTTGALFTHNVWPNSTNTQLFTTDERANAFVEAYDISDPDNIEFLDAYEPLLTVDRNLIPHNVHWRDSFLIISYYAEGIKIVDAHRPTNLIEVGAYDTYTFRYDGFSGCWGAFPFFESGLVLGSDRSTGLWVMKPNYNRASYLEGLVIDAATSEPIRAVAIDIDSELPGEAITDLRGEFQTGLGAEGTFEVNYSAPGYASQKLTYEFKSGEVIFDTILLEAFEQRTISGFIKNMVDNSPIEDVEVAFFDNDERHSTVTDDQGFYSLTLPNQTYEIIAGKWGFLYANGAYDPDSPEEQEDILLGLGYSDNFFFNYDWQISGSAAPNRNWGIGEPIGSWYNDQFASPNGDLPNDVGTQCMNTGGFLDGLGNNLQDTGILKSPTAMDVRNFNNPILAFSLWYQVQGVNPNDDILEIRLIQNGEITTILSNPPTESAWVDYSFELNSLIDVNAPFEFEVFGLDQINPHIYEAAIDGFSVTDGIFVNTENSANNSLIKIWPNPVQDVLNINIDPSTINSNFSTRIIDMLGNTQSSWKGLENNINVSDLPPGTYWIELYNFSNKILHRSKFVKY